MDDEKKKQRDLMELEQRPGAPPGGASAGGDDDEDFPALGAPARKVAVDASISAQKVVDTRSSAWRTKLDSALLDEKTVSAKELEDGLARVDLRNKKTEQALADCV